MVITGYTPSGSQHSGKVKVINLKEPTLDCPSIPQYPYQRGMFGAYIGCDQVMVCGGYNVGGSGYTDECYILVKNGSVSEIRIKETYFKLIIVILMLELSMEYRTQNVRT